MNQFLKLVKTQGLKRFTSKVFILGNEAGDLDSIASALALAYFCNKRNGNLNKNENENSIPFSIPVLNFERKYLHLRPDVIWLFNFLNIETKYLLFWEDLSIGEWIDSIILVDHNKLSCAQAGLESHVLAILDHHECGPIDETNMDHLVWRRIERVGSTSTLISEFMISREDECPLSDEETCIYKLLLGAIVLDTEFLNIETKATRQDDREYNRLLEALGMSTEDARIFYMELLKQRYSTDSFSSSDLLRSDYKGGRIGRLGWGISSVRVSVHDWMVKDKNLVETIRMFVKEQGLDVFLIMTAEMGIDGVRSRNLIVFHLNDFFDLRVILESSDLDLYEERVYGDLTFYNQGNIKASRKQIQPLITQFCLISDK